jgi:type I restriction enzyme, S subunit
MKPSLEPWPRVRLGDVAAVISGYAFKSNDFCDSEIPVIKIKNIRVGFIDLADAVFVKEDFLRIPQRYHVCPGDI